MSDLHRSGPADAGISSLSSSARRRREGAAQFAARTHEWIEGWRCEGPTCNVALHPFESGRFFYCSDACRAASLAAERKKQGRR